MRSKSRTKILSLFFLGSSSSEWLYADPCTQVGAEGIDGSKWIEVFGAHSRAGSQKSDAANLTDRRKESNLIWTKPIMLRALLIWRVAWIWLLRWKLDLDWRANDAEVDQHSPMLLVTMIWWWSLSGGRNDRILIACFQNLADKTKWNGYTCVEQTFVWADLQFPDLSI